MPNETPVVSLPLLGIAVTLGNLAVWLGLASAVTCVVLYWVAMLRTVRAAKAGAAAEPTEVKQLSGKKGKRAAAADSGGSAEERKTDAIAVWARRFFFITCSFVILGSIALMTLILTQSYTVQYVYKSSNNALPFGYRFASFWSNQEGTFFLWGMYNVVLGSLLVWKARDYERWTMPFFTLVNVSLFTLLTFMNPFWLQPAEEVRKGLGEAMVSWGHSPEDIAKNLAFLPTNTWQHIVYYFGWSQYLNPTLLDGKGLNEQLQNFWMVIHPPTLFVGYSSLIIPSCFALGALMKRDYDGWVTRAFPWLLFSWTVLGTGIFLGAYWAYETLGWGGYWSWDPVENASFVPWVVGTAMIHGMVAQKNRGNYKQANLFLGVMAGFAVLLGSFLVRSGVLSETSVHSFASPQQSVFVTLLVVMIAWFLLGVGLWLWRFKEIQSEIAYENVWERHFGFFLGLIVLSAIALVIMFGVTFPIWKPWLPIGGGKANVDFTFYNKALLPVVFVMVLLMALTPLMPWKRVQREGEAPRPMKPFNTVALWLSGLFTLFFLGAAGWAFSGGFITRNDPAYVAVGLMLALALVTNIACLARAARGGFLHTGPWLAHIGFITMLAGVIITSRFNTTHSFSKMELGEYVQVLGREFAWAGQEAAKGPGDRERMLIDMRMPDGKVTRLKPKLFVSKISEQTMAWPQIINEWIGGAWGDVYVEPSGVDLTGAISVKDIRKGVPADARVQHKRNSPEDFVAVTFTGLDTSEMQKTIQSGKQGPFVVWADVTLNVNGFERQERVGLRLNPGPSGPTPESVPLRVQGLNQPTGYSLVFKDTNMDPADLTASFELVPDVPVKQGYFQVLHVPGIQVLWFGIYICLAGGVICWRRRVALARRPEVVKEAEPVSRPEKPEGRTVGEAKPVGAE